MLDLGHKKKGCIYKYWNQVYLLSDTKVWKLKYRDNIVVAYHAYRGKPLHKVNEIEFNTNEDVHKYIKYQNLDLKQYNRVIC